MNIHRSNIVENPLELVIDTNEGCQSPLAGPLSAVINVTKRCNSACLYCSIWELHQPAEPTLEEIRRILYELADNGTKQVSFSGGEPTLRSDLSEIVRTAKGLGLAVNISTNGLSLDRTLLQDLEASGLDFLIISLDTLDPDTYRLCRGVLIDAVRNALDLIAELSTCGFNIVSSINCVISRVNLSHVVPLVIELTRKGIFTGFQPFHDYPTTSSKTIGILRLAAEEEKALRQTISELISLKSTGALISSSIQYLQGIVDFMIYRKGPKHCMAGLFGTNIDQDLNVKPCWLLPPVGNLREEDFPSIWHGRKYDEARSRMSQKKCTGCWLRCHAEMPLLWRAHFGEFPGNDISQLKAWAVEVCRLSAVKGIEKQ